MGCTACAKKKANSYQDFKALESPPYRATDILVYDIQSGEYRKFVNTDWNTKITNVLLFVPSVESIKELEEQPPQEGIEFTYVTNQPVHQIKDYFDNTDVTLAYDRIFVSYLLPSRMNLLYNGFAKKAVAYVMTDGDTVVQQYFYNSSFNYDSIHQYLEDYWHDNN
jgi:hypothetical protein